jgi:hypothetical protein
MDIFDARFLIRLELITASSKQILDGAKVFFANVEMLAELGSMSRQPLDQPRCSCLVVPGEVAKV